MIGGKRKGSVVPPPPPSSSMAKDGGGDVVVGGKCAVVGSVIRNALPPVSESAKEEEKKMNKTPAKAASVNGDDLSESDDDDDDDDEEEDEESEDEEEEESEDKDSEIEEREDNAGEAEPSEKPELAEGFYIIEAVKAHRNRRGKREYRIKWQGWPDSANTWEPMENLKTVPKLIANYEASLRVKAKRKRKRRNTYSFSRQPTRKKQKRSPATATAAAVKRTVPAGPLKIVKKTTIPAVAAESDNVVLSSGVVTDTGITDLDAGEQSNGVDLASSGNKGTGIEDKDVIMTSDKEKGQVDEQSQVNPQEAQLTGGNVVANGSEKTESSEEALLQAGRSTGSRRRKSGPVKRFKLEPHSGSGDNLENAALNGVSTGLDGNRSPRNLDSRSNNVRSKDTRKNICDIIEIVKPIKYTSFMTCNTLDVCVTFLVKRSDGKEMTVDNKFLKAHCPALLVDFYEQRLRY